MSETLPSSSLSELDSLSGLLSAMLVVSFFPFLVLTGRSSLLKNSTGGLDLVFIRSWINPIYSSFQKQKEILKIIGSKSANSSSKRKFTVPYDANRNLSSYWLPFTVKNRKIPHYERKPIPSKLIYTQGVEIALKATIRTRNNNFQNKD
jgi:hypothetical protein